MSGPLEHHRSQVAPTRRALLQTAAASIACAALAPRQALAQDVPQHITVGSTTVRFASVEAGRNVLSANDGYMRTTSAFQRRAVVGREQPVSVEEFRAWSGDAARPWPAEHRERWLKVLATLLPAYAELRVPLPDEVLLIATNGQESSRAPHTRANGVVLPIEPGKTGYADDMLMAHELWHVAARHAPALATRLYAEIGFDAMPTLAFPAEWADIRIANPDAPENRHAMPLTIEGRNVRVTPVLVASRTKLEPRETFFNVIDVRLLEVETDPSGTASRAVTAPDGSLRWHPMVDAYLKRLGGNTGYVIHPEETMADNVALLGLKLRSGADRPAPPVRNAELLSRVQAVLLRGS